MPASGHVAQSIKVMPEDQLDSANNLLDKIGVKAYEIGKVVEFDASADKEQRVKLIC